MSLAGKTIVVTRPKHQAPSFIKKIEAYGARAFLLPAIELSPPQDSSPLIAALRNAGQFDWIIFTSVNGVEAVRKTLEAEDLSPSSITERKLAAIGPATANALTAHFRAPDIVPNDYISDDIPKALGDVQGKKILLPRADIARKQLRTALEELGAQVTDVAAYEIRENNDRTLIENLKNQGDHSKPDFFTVTSSSTVRGLYQLLQASDKLHWLKQTPLASIGPITAETAQELGLSTDIIAKDYTTDGLLEAIIQWENDNDKNN